MGVRITPISTKFLNEFKNGEVFNADLSDYTNNLTGSVMESQTTALTLDVDWFSKTKDTGATWTVSNINGRLESTAGDFTRDGFSVGDEFIYEEISAGAGSNFSGLITALSPKLIIFTNLTGSGEFNNDNSIIRGVTPLTSLIHKFSLIENNDSFNTSNIITGSDSAYYGSGLTVGGPWVVFNGLGQNKDWEDGTFRCRKLTNPNTYTQRFEIEHKFLIPFYSEGDNLSLLPTYLDGLKSLKYVFESGFRTVISNPNTEKTQIQERQLGSVAGFGENFNGFDNNYSVKSIAYEDANTGGGADGLIISGKTKVTVVIDKVLGSFNVDNRYGVYCSYKAEEERYQNTTLTDFKTNFIYDRSLNSVGLGATVGDTFITNNTATINGSGDLVIVFDVEYTMANKLFLTNQFGVNTTEFIIGVNIGDENLTNGNSDRVMLLAANTLYDLSADISGLMAFEKFDFYAHDKPVASGDGSTDLTAWNEDGFTVDFNFNIDLNKEAFINSLDIKLVAENNNEVFELDSFNYPIAGGVVSGGIQQLNVSTTRGYILELTDQFNDVALSVGNNAAGVQSYNGRFSQKISWQDWIENLNVDSIFYDNSKPENNRNYKTSNYSDLNGYNIKVAISSNLYGVNDLGASGFTDYLFLSPTIRVFDYDLDINVVPIWAGEIETFSLATMTNLNGAVLTGQDTLLRTTWTNSGGAVTDLSYIEGINRMEETNQVGYSITEMSSINLPASNQILKPYTGSYSNVYISGGKVIVESLIDGSIAKSGVSYNLSARIFNCVQNVGKMTEAGVYKVTELNVQKIIE